MIADRVDAMDDGQLAALPDEELAIIAESAIHDAALMNGTRFANTYHERCDRVHDECKRRARGIYQRAFNSVVLSQGHRKMVQQVEDGDP